MLDKAVLVGSNLRQGEIDHKSRGIFFGLFITPKTIYCLTINEFGIIEEHKTFRDFNHSKRLLDCSQFLNMIDGIKISAVLPKIWKKNLSY